MIYLLRHGEIEMGKEKRYIGWTDPPLSNAGVQQAEQWQETLSNVPFENIFCSDLKRARQTAGIVCRDSAIPVQERDTLREINLGKLENRSMIEFRKQHPEAWQQRGKNIFTDRPNGGESFADLQTRVLPEFEKIMLKTVENTLIVGHAGVNRIILCHLLGMPPQQMFRLGQDYAGLNVIDHKKRPYRVNTLNLRLTTISMNT